MTLMQDQNHAAHSSLLGRVRTYLHDWAAYKRDRASLEALDDRALHDIGISRGEIDTLLRKH